MAFYLLSSVPNRSSVPSLPRKLFDIAYERGMRFVLSSPYSPPSLLPAIIASHVCLPPSSMSMSQPRDDDVKRYRYHHRARTSEREIEREREGDLRGNVTRNLHDSNHDAISQTRLFHSCFESRYAAVNASSSRNNYDT